MSIEDTNKYIYYNRSKDAWNVEEIEQLKREYNEDNLDILQCGIIHRKTPGCIAAKLMALKIISHRRFARGYTEYVSSALYTDILASYDKEKTIKKEKIDKKIEKPTRVSSWKKSIEDEILEIKKDVKEILRLMNCIYEFETSE